MALERLSRSGCASALQCHWTGSLSVRSVSWWHGLSSIQRLRQNTGFERPCKCVASFSILGLDLAFVQNGYWWHTEFDEAVRITNGSLQVRRLTKKTRKISGLQRAGENVYSVLTHLLASPYLERPAEYGDKRSVFFDFLGKQLIWKKLMNLPILGLFVVVYDVKISHMINIVAIFIGFLVTMARFFQDRILLFHFLPVVQYFQEISTSELSSNTSQF